MKPVELMERAIVNSSRPGGTVLDPFSGSGSTLIACERTGRICITIELDPKFVDVTIKRWQVYTGREVFPLALAKLLRKFKTLEAKKEKKVERITQTEWAREKGFSKQYVSYLVKKGIVELKDGLIDPEQANRAVEAVRDPSQPLRRKGGEEKGASDLSTMLLKT